MSQQKIYLVLPWLLAGTVSLILWNQTRTQSLTTRGGDAPANTVATPPRAVSMSTAAEAAVDLRQQSAGHLVTDGGSSAHAHELNAPSASNEPNRPGWAGPGTDASASSPQVLVLQELPTPPAKSMPRTTEETAVAQTPIALDLRQSQQNTGGAIPPHLMQQKHVVNEFFRPQSGPATKPASAVVDRAESFVQKQVANATTAGSDFSVSTVEPNPLDRSPAMVPTTSTAGPVANEFRPLQVSPAETAPQPRSPEALVVGLPAGAGHAASQHIEYGKTLARRGAIFSARREFAEALRVIATSLDQASNTQRHTQQLNRGWLILREAESLQAAIDSALTKTAPIDLTQIISAHLSGVLAATEAQSLSGEQLLGRYYQQAKQCFAIAGGANAVSAESLHCLGKLYGMLASQPGPSAKYHTDSAMLMFSAALDCHPQHHHAANELGVMLASQGHLAAAKQRLWQSIQAQPTGQAWTNIAEVHQRLGESSLADQARQRAESFGNLETAAHNRLFQWVPPQQFDANQEADVSLDFSNAAEQSANSSSAPTGTQANKSSWIDKILR